MSAYVVLLIAVGMYFHHFHPGGVLAYLLALLPAAAIIAQIVTVGLYLGEEKDEFQRNLFIQALLWGLGGVLALTSTWGMLESFTHIQHFQPIWTFSVFWCLVGVCTPFLMKRYR
jgi:hypothetical protein